MSSNALDMELVRNYLRGLTFALSIDIKVQAAGYLALQVLACEPPSDVGERAGDVSRNLQVNSLQ